MLNFATKTKVQMRHLGLSLLGPIEGAEGGPGSKVDQQGQKFLLNTTLQQILELGLQRFHGG